MIGAMELSMLFYELEKLGNANDKEQIALKNPEALRLYRSYKVVLEEYGTSGTEQKKVSYSQMISTLKRIHDAVSILDLTETDNAMAELENYEFPDDMKEMVGELSVYVTDFAIDDVIRITQVMCDKLLEKDS
jgi:hypothetical protein